LSIGFKEEVNHKIKFAPSSQLELPR